jgi:CheY-like chemotaxis protein
MASWAGGAFLGERRASSRRRPELRVPGEYERSLAAEARHSFPSSRVSGDGGLTAVDRHARLDGPAGGPWPTDGVPLPASLSAGIRITKLPRVGRRLRVLIADDHPLFADAVKRVLEVHSWIHVVGCAANGREAVELAAALSPDVILIDLDMPVMDGLEATRRILERGPVPVLMLTGSATPQTAAEALEAGVYAFLRKDVDPIELVGRLHELSVATVAQSGSTASTAAQATT